MDAAAKRDQTIEDVISAAYLHSGLSKREYFAGLALQGMIAHCRDDDYERVARMAVRQADALIAELAGSDGSRNDDALESLTAFNAARKTAGF